LKSSILSLLDTILFFAELGRLCRYDSSSGNLRHLRWWGVFDLLVWNSADTTRKTNWVIVSVAEAVKTLLS